MKNFLMSLVASITFCNWIPQEHRDDFISTSKQWLEFKTKFNKSYHHDWEFISATQFIANHKSAAEFNVDKQNNGEDLRLEINEFADMKYQDFIKIRGGFRGMRKNVGHYNLHVQSGAQTAASVDWRKKDGVLAPVQNQGQCGSCWAFSATAAMESGQAILKNKPVVKLSEQELVNCESEDQGCSGGLMDHAFAWIEHNGMTTEEKIPYTAQDGSCKYNRKEAVVFNKGQTDVETTDEALMEAVAMHPVAIGVAANNAWQLQFGGVVKYENCPDADLDHGVVLVGQTEDKWIIRNSWGESWGNSGYIQLEKGKNTCGIRNSASQPTF